MQTIVYQCDTAMPAQKLPNCCGNLPNKMKSQLVSDTLAVVIFYLVRHEFFSNFAGASVH